MSYCLDMTSDDLTKSAEDVAKRLEMRARAIRTAARTINRIVNKASRSELGDGKDWDHAAALLKEAGIAVPDPAHLTWAIGPKRRRRVA